MGLDFLSGMVVALAIFLIGAIVGGLYVLYRWRPDDGNDFELLEYGPDDDDWAALLLSEEAGRR